MIIKDSVYGTIEINEPVIVELINSRPLQRLKNIDQAGYIKPHFDHVPHTRFEHSIGVYYLLKIYNASLEEQIAGLIHDVSHLAFSHCADYVLNQEGMHKQDLQDNLFKEYVMNSEIPIILRKFNLDVEYILDEKNFSLLETTLPDLCADRIDYIMRAAVHFLKYDQKFCKNLMSNLKVKDNVWFFANQKSAKDYAILFEKINVKYFSGTASAKMFYSLSEYLLYALEKNYIQKQDLFEDDEFVLKKISQHHAADEKLQKLFEQMNSPTLINEDKNDFHREIVCKSRMVDPFFEKNGELKRLSEVDETWKKFLPSKSQPKSYYLGKID